MITMIRKLAAACMFFLLLASAAEAGTAMKVLILDDVFQNIPSRDEKIERMGKLKGDLLVNGTRYPGNIEVWKGKAGLYLINELPLEEYIKSVVSAEVGADWDMEALKTQAVISRTYALYQKAQNNNPNFDLTSSVLHQVYKGSSENARIAYAVMNTEGEVLTYNGRIIEAFYHSTSGGLTEAPEEVFGKGYPYLKPVSGSCESSPYWIWERRIPIEEVEKVLNIPGIRDITITSYTSTKRVKTVDVAQTGSAQSMKATDLRKAIGWNRLPSTNFTVSRDNNVMVFDGKGFGHGVGLCQWSSLEMAKSGVGYKDILAYFYPGTVLQQYENR
ncbi:MAG: SpoIID/LytB domain-containing protein [Nitrospirae bacterium]|nr:SpoIID/LytB domain-containing protein [Nitrospirota bacterium]